MQMMKRLALLAAVLCCLGTPAFAQVSTRVQSSIYGMVPATASGSLAAQDAAATVDLRGFPGVAVQATGTWVGTLTFEVSVDGTTYQAANVVASNGSSTLTTSTGNGVWAGSVAGYSKFRVRMSSYSSGTAVVTVSATLGGGGGGGGGGTASTVTIADPTTGSQKVAVNASGQMSITCANCSGSGASAVDTSVFTQGTNSIAPAGGLFTTSYTGLASGKTGIFQMTTDGALFANLFKIAGTAVDVNSGNKSAGTLRVTLATDQVQLTNALKVDGSAVTQPISGTLTANAGTGTFTNQQSNVTSDYDSGAGTQTMTMFGLALPASGGAVAGGTSTNPIQVSLANTATNATAVKVDNSGVTQPISASALPLPSGASTSAKQPALGTPGSASADVLTVQGVASMTPILVNGSAVTQPVSLASVPLPSGAATSAKQPALGTAGSPSTDILTVQGATSMTPLKTDGSGVTQPISGTVTVTQGTAANLKVDPSGVTSPISAASLPLPTGAASAANQTGGSQKTQIVDGSGNVIASTSNNLNVQCANCSGSGASAVDAATFTATTSVFAPAGGFFQTTATSNALTTGQQGMWQMTANRAGFVNLRNASGTEIGTSSTPVQVSLANTGANATAVKVDNSAVTQPVSGSVTVTQATGTNLHTVCDSGCSSSTAPADNSAFTAGTTSSSPMSGFYHSTRDTLTDGRIGAVALTSKRAMFMSPEDVNGVAATDSTAHAIKTLAVDSTGTAIAPSTDATTNTASQTTGPQIFVNGSTAAPTAVGADGRSIAAWADTIGRLHVTGDSSMTALKVDGSAVTQPVSISGNQAVNLAQVAGATTATGHGTASGAIRVELPTDGTGVVGLNAGSAIVGKVGIDQTTPGTTNGVRQDTSGATGAAPPARADFIGGIASGATGGFIAGIPVCDASKSVSITSATTTLMITGVSGRQVRICAIHLVTAIANNVALVEGTGATCGTGTAGMAGGTTAANGWNFAANGGLALGSGIGTVISTATTGDSVCLITSAAGPLAGTISYTIY